MSVKYFMSDDRYEQGNPYGGGPSRAAMPGGVNLISMDAHGIVGGLESMLKMYLMKEAAIGLGSTALKAYSERKASEDPNLTTALLAAAVPTAMVSGFLGAMSKAVPKSTFSSALRALR